MKSSDYFSRVYEPSKRKDTSIEQYNKRRQESIRNAKIAEVENMLIWLDNETEHAFNCIPEAELRKLVPNKIEFKFIHNKYGNYIHVVLYKYYDRTDIFGDTIYDTVEHKMPFYNFEAMPEIYRSNWKEVTTSLYAGTFAVHGLPGPPAGVAPKRPYIGVYKTVYERIYNSDRIDDYGYVYRYYVRE